MRSYTRGGSVLKAGSCVMRVRVSCVRTGVLSARSSPARSDAIVLRVNFACVRRGRLCLSGPRSGGVRCVGWMSTGVSL